jgi:hypothetical protein
MVDLAPPKAPASLVVTSDDGLYRLRFRLWQILMTALTVLFTTWFCTFGPVSTIVAIMVAKHVLVAILVAGLHLPPPSKRLDLDRT